MRIILLMLILTAAIFSVEASERFVRNGEIVIDKTTGLMWQDAEDTVTVQMNFREATLYCQNLKLGGYSGWRLPHISELRSTNNLSTHNPPVASAFQNIASSWYWSFTDSSLNTTFAWYAGYEYGYGSYERDISKLHVRCVRSGR